MIASNALPLVRARHPQMMLQQVLARTPDEYASFLELLAPSSRAAMAEAIPFAWLPVEIDVEVTEAVARRFGIKVSSALVAARQREELGSALFNTFLKAIIRLSGATPALIVKHLPTGWNQIYSACGTVTMLDSKPGESRASLTGLPPVCATAEAWRAGIPAAFQSVCDTVGVKATVEAQFHEAAKGTVLVIFRW